MKKCIIMINTLLLSLLHDIFAFLKEHRNFFQKDEKGRRELISGKNLFPEIFEQYLGKISETEFLYDIQNYKTFEKNKFLETFSRYLVTDFAALLDKVTHANSTVPKTYGLFGTMLLETLEENSYQEITEEVSRFLEKTKKSPSTIVQTARNISSTFREEIRKKLLGMNPMIFPIFQVNRNLIGGMRIFSNGKTLDESWFSRINTITTINIP
ncbi:F0F1 ATP synthase subunit delta [Candidatus Peregrinibacteria bacterium]|nr:F0F1 ATP synthase subunit delta [Candidatus Peregrinibacteria bacterium]